MHETCALAGAVVLAAVTATRGGVDMASGKPPTPAAQEAPANTATVERGKLSAKVPMYGTPTHEAHPYAVINRAWGTYTTLADAGDNVDCGAVLLQVNDKPVLLRGSTAGYRSLSERDSGTGVTDPETDGSIMLRASGPIDSESAQFNDAEQVCAEFTPGRPGSPQGEGRTL
jgi:hypothetical protein